MRSEQTERPDLTPAAPEPPRPVAGLYGEVAVLPIERRAPPVERETPAYL